MILRKLKQAILVALSSSIIFLSTSCLPASNPDRFLTNYETVRSSQTRPANKGYPQCHGVKISNYRLPFGAGTASTWYVGNDNEQPMRISALHMLEAIPSLDPSIRYMRYDGPAEFNKWDEALSVIIDAPSKLFDPYSGITNNTCAFSDDRVKGRERLQLTPREMKLYPLYHNSQIAVYAYPIDEHALGPYIEKKGDDVWVNAYKNISAVDRNMPIKEDSGAPVYYLDSTGTPHIIGVLLAETGVPFIKEEAYSLYRPDNTMDIRSISASVLFEEGLPSGRGNISRGIARIEKEIKRGLSAMKQDRGDVKYFIYIVAGRKPYPWLH